MRSFFGSIASLLLVMLVIGCNTVDPSECWPNTSGGFGGGGTNPLAAGVGATTSGDFISPPPKGPLDESGTPNPCVTPESPPQSTCQGGNTASDGATVEVCSSACAGKCATVNGPFAPSIFKFVTIIPDDGTASGWQEASASLKIVRLNYLVVPEIWYCPVIKIGMPMRTTLDGPISPAYAATISAQIANKAARKVRTEEPDLPQGIFCSRIKSYMKSFFPTDHPTLGATVN
jgi:hypothetical protein